MKKLFSSKKRVLCAILVVVLILSTTVYAASRVRYANIKVGYADVGLVIDGHKITPRDSKGNVVEPFIYNGTTYLPVRAVADSLGKAVYWDGPNYTVYLGDMDGTLEYPTKKMEDMTNIGWWIGWYSNATDNYGNKYSSYAQIPTSTVEYLLDMKYSRFKATVFVNSGTTSSYTNTIEIIADGHTIYTSPEMDKTSHPLYIDVDVTGYNDFKIRCTGNGLGLYIADAGFYQ